MFRRAGHEPESVIGNDQGGAICAAADLAAIAAVADRLERVSDRVKRKGG